MEAFSLRIEPHGRVEIVQAGRVPAIGEAVVDGMDVSHVVEQVRWDGAYEPDGIRVLLAYVVAR